MVRVRTEVDTPGVGTTVTDYLVDPGGRNELSHVVAESFPEQIFFSFKAGRTRDLRSHIHIYALRSNVTWGGP